jgi:hypothetical protein
VTFLKTAGSSIQTAESSIQTAGSSIQTRNRLAACLNSGFEEEDQQVGNVILLPAESVTTFSITNGPWLLFLLQKPDGAAKSRKRSPKPQRIRPMLTFALITTAATVTTLIAPAVALKLMLNRHWNEPEVARFDADEAPRSFVRSAMTPSTQPVASTQPAG